MSSVLTIWLPVDLNGDWHWHVSSGSYGVASGLEEKAELKNKPHSRIHIIIPGQWVSIFDHDLPDMRSQERIKAAGFAIEDRLAMPLNDVHVALSKGQKLGVISIAKMRAIESALKLSGISPDGIYADFNIIPEHIGPIQLEDSRIIPGPDGYAVDRHWARLIEESASNQLSNLNDISSKLDYGPAINFAQGVYAKRSQLAFSSISWKRIAALLIISGISWGALQALKIRSINSQTDFIQTQTAQIYEQATGQDAPANPALDITRRLKGSSQTQSAFLETSNLLFNAVAGLDGVVIDTIQFNSSKNEIFARLMYPNFESATELERALSELGAQYISGGVREQDGQLFGEATISLGSIT